MDLRDRLARRLSRFAHLHLVTLTLRPETFSGCGKEAHDYVRKHRCIARFVEELRRRDYLNSSHCFWMMEWHANSLPHFHLVLDARDVPLPILNEVWNRLSPEDGTGALGRVDARLGSGSPANVGKLANYLKKLLRHYPPKGFPEWVLNTSHIRRYSSSRGFWSPPCPAETSAGDDSTPGTMNGGQQNEPSTIHSLPATDRETIGAGIGRCGSTCRVLRVVRAADPETNEIVERMDFVGILAEPLEEVCRRFRHAVRLSAHVIDVFYSRDVEALTDLLYHEDGRTDGRTYGGRLPALARFLLGHEGISSIGPGSG